MIENLWTFINNRYSIYLKRKAKQPPPWTDDPILQQYRFANIFRELDPTTIALRRVLNKLYHEYKGERVRKEHYNYKEEGVREDYYIKDQFVNVVLYRVFNHRRNTKFGPIYNTTAFYYFVRNEFSIGQPITKEDDIATLSFPSELEHLCRVLVSETNLIIRLIKSKNTLQYTFDTLLEYAGVDEALAYDLVCDLRYTDILRHATDVNSWGYIGGGASRGLERLGLDITIVRLFVQSYNELRGEKYINYYDSDQVEHWIEKHFMSSTSDFGDTTPNKPKYPYWELREIVTSLRLFDQYESIRLGEEHSVPLFEGGKL